MLTIAISIAYAVASTRDRFAALIHSASGREEIGMAARIEPILTGADLDACPDDSNRYELIEGELFVSRALGIPHQRVLNNLQYAFGSYLKEAIDTEGRYVLIYQLHGLSLDEVATLRKDDRITTSVLPGFDLKVGEIFNL